MKTSDSPLLVNKPLTGKAKLFIYAGAAYCYLGGLTGFPVHEWGRQFEVIGAASVIALFPFLLAYTTKCRHRPRDWEGFARWFFWGSLALLAWMSRQQH